jgi:hypothetical protein
MVGKPTPPIDLRDAPALFLKDAWADLVEKCGNHDRALELLSRLNPGFLDYVDEELRDGDEKALRQARRKLAKELIAEFKRMLTEGEIVATGLSPASPTRKKIDDGLVRDLEFDFAKNAANSHLYAFTHIQVYRAKPPATRLVKFDIWLRNQKEADPNRVRKELLADAVRLFGITQREFQKSYRAVFAKPRGRPPGQKSTKPR